MNPNQPASTNPIKILQNLARHRGLIWQLTKRDVIGRYKGSALGLFWSFFHPLLMLAIYTFVFSTVFKVRWSSGSESKTEFALAIFIGIIAHSLLAESINRAPALILQNVSYVKKVIFPLEILPLVSMGATLFHTLISIIVWSLFYLIVNQTFHVSIMYLPLIFLPLILISLGVSWFIASLGVYLRDVGQITGVLTTILLFMAPIFYPLSRLPERYHAFLYANPLTFTVEQSRAVLMWGQAPDWNGLAIILPISISIAWLGFIWFQKTRNGFADVL